MFLSIVAPILASEKFEVLLGVAEIHGVTYHCRVDVAKVKDGPQWDFGKDEPPLGPNKAMSIAGEAVKKFFPAVEGLDCQTISLVRFHEGAVYQAIFDDSPPRAIGDRTNMRNYVYVYVYMDGSVVVPQKAAENEQIQRPAK